ncbi:MAG: cell division ATP-binding protein FtsE [Bacillus sp. (in: firmicutes)]
MYDNKAVLNGLNLTLSTGEFAFLQGRSGCGKSTLLKLLYKEVADYEGSIFIDDESIEQLPKYELRRKMGIIFQSFQLLERKTVMENVLLAGEVLGKDVRKLQVEATRLLNRVGLDDKYNHYPHQLSGGEQQRVAIVRALLNRPRLLLADEPTGNLDTQTALDILRLLKELHEEEQMAMLIVTHSEQLMEAFPSKTFVMEEGKVYESAIV